MEAEAQSDIHFVSVEFVKEGGRPGHEGLFRIQGQPVAGRPATLEALLSAAATKTTDFRLVTERGETIQKLQIRTVSSDRTTLEFVGSLEVPKVPFRVAVTGRDANGQRYQRFFGGLFHAESVEVSPKLDFDELLAGSTKRATFTVHNIGSPRTFRIVVTDARQLVRKVEPKELSLGMDESGIVQVQRQGPFLPAQSNPLMMLWSSLPALQGPTRQTLVSRTFRFPLLTLITILAEKYRLFTSNRCTAHSWDEFSC